jgi:hypothetical protein
MFKSWSAELKSLPQGQYVSLHDNLRTLTFNIISRAAFGVKILWPGSQEEVDGILATKLESGHKMRFGDATLSVVGNLSWLFVVPLWILSKQNLKPFCLFAHMMYRMGTVGIFQQNMAWVSTV